MMLKKKLFLFLLTISAGFMADPGFCMMPGHSTAELLNENPLPAAFPVSPVDSIESQTEECIICLEEKPVGELRPICGNVSSKGIMCSCKCCGVCTQRYLKANAGKSLINLHWPKIGDWKFQGATEMRCPLRQLMKNRYFNQWIKFRNYSPVLIKDKLIISAPKIVTVASLWLALLGVGACGAGVNLFKAING